MNGQAQDAPASAGLDDLASFLDTPEEESTQEIEAQDADESTGDADTEETANDEQEETEAESEDEAKDPAPVEKITVKVKGEDGTEETIELTPDEIASSYLRQKDYTKKTQALAARESEAVEFLTNKHNEIRQQYVSQAETARAAVAQMAGLKSGEEMAQLAHSDPAAWVAENQRQQSINAFLNGLDQRIAGEKEAAKTQAEQAQQQRMQAMFMQTWTELEKAGIDKPKLAKIYGGVTKNYGVSEQELAGVYDHRYVNIMKDALAFRELQAKKPEVTKKVAEAPRLPTRQTQPAETRKDQALNARFKSGRARLSDLAAYIS